MMILALTICVVLGIVLGSRIARCRSYNMNKSDVYLIKNVKYINQFRRSDSGRSLLINHGLSHLCDDPSDSDFSKYLINLGGMRKVAKVMECKS